MNTIWRIELFGGLVAQRCDGEARREPVIRRFRTHKTGALMALLAFSRRAVAREVLIDELWPEATLATGRNNLRIALSSLRRQLEPPDVAPGSIVRADRITVGFDSGTVITDVEEFEAHLQAAHAAGSTNDESRAQRRQHLSAACELFRSPFLPGYYENWISAQAQCFEGQYLSALLALVDLLESESDFAAARDWVWRGLAVDPDHRELRRRETGLSERATVVPSKIVGAGAATKPTKQKPRIKPHALPFAGKKDALQETLQLDSLQAVSQNLAPADLTTGLESTTSVRVQLPPLWNQFFAREREIALLTSWLHSEVRLITLHGAGGTGKTRLAIEIARHLAGSASRALPEVQVSSAQIDFDEAIGAIDTAAKVLWRAIAFVPLAAITRADLITVAIADALQLPRADELPPLDRVVHALAGCPTLLVLDNFEQLAGEGTPVVQSLLERLPMLKLLVTSRQRLGLSGEREWALSPLPVPSLQDNSREFESIDFESIEDEMRRVTGFEDPTGLMMSSLRRKASEWPSVRLFVDRARAVRADFGITRRNVRDVITLVRRLEGLPLAIELAAARAGVLSPGAMLAQLDAPLDFLQTRRVVEPRHASLRSCVEWSYRLLPAALQELWTCLSVLRGSWSLEAACAVCCGSKANDARQSVVLEQLEALRDASFIVFDDRAGAAYAAVNAGANASGAWFRMLEVLQAFADERLTDERRAILHARHAVYFADLVERMEAHFMQTGQRPGFADADQDNFRALFERALEHRNAHQLEAALRTAGALWWFWPARGHSHEARDYLKRLLEAAREMEERGLEERALQECDAESRVPVAIVAKAKLCAGLMAYHGGQSREARASLESALACYRALGDAAGMASAQNYLGTEALSRMDIEAARAHFTASLEVHRAHANARQIAIALSCLAGVAVAANCSAQAQQPCHEASLRWRDLNDRGGQAWILGLQGIVAENEGDVPTARVFFTRALELRRASGSAPGIATALFDLGRAIETQGHSAAALDLYRQSLSIRQRLGYHRDLLDVLEAVAGASAAVAASRTQHSAVEPAPGAALPAIPVDTPNNSPVSATAGIVLNDIGLEQARRAARVLGATQSWRESLGFARPHHIERLWQRANDHVRRILKSEFETQYAVGASLTIEDAVHCLSLLYS